MISFWIRNKEDQIYTWTLAIAFTIADKTFNWDQIADYKKNFRESRAYKSYIKTHPDHDLIL